MRRGGGARAHVGKLRHRYNAFSMRAISLDECQATTLLAGVSCWVLWHELCSKRSARYGCWNKPQPGCERIKHDSNFGIYVHILE